ncbi:hypothetical protein QWJ34_21010 [Saccharibacillus sp. CPCC 101409]|uniref:hypothetical protein n=1 Tax=Saccharibacillus sp. CPCC 101409 TaxID=3058041 RepID=UPI0026712CA8|nr:hypothetical protein [Saccharibacillus sp. CPCC 101409]MDO3412257.1 hypothetical protein [Saccharibacillus sp. CPCC 101409]
MRFKRRVLLPLLALLIVIGGCSEESAKPETSSETAVEPDKADDGGQTITLVEPEEGGGDNEHEKYVVQTRLTELHLFDDTTGMAWGLTRSALRIYLTANNGKNWIALSPSEQVEFSSLPAYGEGMFFTDAKHGWIVRSAGASDETLVLRTVDGGENWSIATLGRTDETPTSLYFSDRNHGWLLLTKTSANAGREDKTLYRTIDGGESWRAVMRTVGGTQPAGSEYPLPDLGYVSGMVFQSASAGYATMLELGKPSLYRTSDAGRNWKKASNFFSAEDPIGSCDAYMSGKPQSYRAGGQGSWIPIGCKQRDTVKYNGYFSQNGGAGWKFVSFDLPAQQSLNQTIAPFFLDRMNGWQVRGNRLYRTFDGGTAWKTLPASDKLAEQMEKYPEVFRLQFVSQKVGWILIGKTEIRRSLLLQTLDGGVTWKVL